MRKLLVLKSVVAAFLLSTTIPAFADSSHSEGDAVNDTVITGKIKSKLAVDKITDAASIGVETNNGLVTLSGTAKTETEATKAIEIAESTDGVKNVNTDNLKISSSDQPTTDAYITAKVKGSFIKNNLSSTEKNVPITTVKVETQDGVVYLSGTVQKTSQIEKLTEIAKSVDGVKSVKTDLKAE